MKTNPDDATDFNSRIIAEFRANAGRVGGPLAGTAVMLIHHIGARSGVERVTPLAYNTLGEGRFAIVASNGGSATHPAWYHNLHANPRIEVELGTETFTALAELVDGAGRDALWPEIVAASPAVGQFQAESTRQIPLFVVTREG